MGVNFPERSLVKASRIHPAILIQHPPRALLTHPQKSVEHFFGVGQNVSSRLLARMYIHPTCKVGDLANKQILDLNAALSEMRIENDLRRKVLDDIRRLRECGSNRGRRHALGLPVHGQSTRTNVCSLLPFPLGSGIGVDWLVCGLMMLTLAAQNCGQA